VTFRRGKALKDKNNKQKHPRMVWDTEVMGCNRMGISERDQGRNGGTEDGRRGGREEGRKPSPLFRHDIPCPMSNKMRVSNLKRGGCHAEERGKDDSNAVTILS
jgi:hypothetical protein